MKWKVGQIFYYVSTDEETGKVEFDEYHVRTIRGGFVHAILKAPYTWGKISKKHGDFGWLPRIPKWTREKWPVDGAPRNMFMTKLAALRDEIKTQDPRNFDDPAIYEKAMKTLRSMETRAKPKKESKNGK
jgi:hypothetical protein